MKQQEHSTSDTKAKVGNKGSSHSMEDEALMQECLENCTLCARVCQEMIPHCISLGGEHAEAAHIQKLMACVAVCQTSAQLMAMGSEFHHDFCGVCAKVCEACAIDCERLAGDDEAMSECASVCRECAASCHEMSGHAH